MKRTILFTLLSAALLTGCGEYSAVQKSLDYDYRYEVAKANFAEGNYNRASQLLGDLIAPLKGTQYGEESLFLLAQSCFRHKDYESASKIFRKIDQISAKLENDEHAR